jgi:putative transferase (TIGR04331 family)
MNKVFLATTALEDFWDMSGYMVFLSDACTRYNRRDIWQKIPHVVLHNPILERHRYYGDYEYVQAFYERLLPQIGKTLNEIHGKSYSIRYWRIVLGLWLFHYIHVLYERYFSIKNAFEKYPDLTTILLDSQDFVVPRDTLDYVLLSVKDTYNLQIYSRIIIFLGKSFPTKRYPCELPIRSLARTKNVLKSLSAEIGCQFAKSAAVIGREPFIPRHIDKFHFFMACRGQLWFDFRPEEQLPSLPSDFAMRKRLAGLKIENQEFEKLFLSTLPYEIPQIFMEGYKNFHKHALRMYPFKPKAIWSTTSWYWDETFKFWSGVRAEEGTKLVGMQHGGNYWMDKILPGEEHEMAICDKYYSWGWEDKIKNIKPMPVTKYIGRKRLDADNHKKGVLYATFGYPRYFVRFSVFCSTDYQPYFQWQLRFMKALSPELKSLTRVRLFIDDYGWDCQERWKDFDSQVKLEDWKTRFSDSMKNCRLHVSDQLSSTFVDALAVGKPTILFWDRELFKVRLQTETYVDDLRQAGILYDSPEEAAAAVNRVYGDVESWWNDPQRQRAVKKFCRHFGRTSPMALSEWAQEIRLLAN